MRPSLQSIIKVTECVELKLLFVVWLRGMKADKFLETVLKLLFIKRIVV